MSVMLGSYYQENLGSLWSDGDILYADDLNDTISVGIPKFIGSFEQSASGNNGSDVGSLYFISDENVHGIFLEIDYDITCTAAAENTSGVGSFSIQADTAPSGTPDGNPLMVFYKYHRFAAGGGVTGGVSAITGSNVTTTKFFDTSFIGSEYMIYLYTNTDITSTGGASANNTVRVYKI